MNTTKLIRGDRRELDIIIRNSSTNEPVDVSESAFVFTVKRRLSDADDAAVFRKTSDEDPGGILILDTGATDDNRGRVRVIFTAADWTDYDAGAGIFPWDLEETPTDGEPTTVAGTMTPLGDDPIEVVLDATIGGSE